MEHSSRTAPARLPRRRERPFHAGTTRVRAPRGPCAHLSVQSKYCSQVDHFSSATRGGGGGGGTIHMMWISCSAGTTERWPSGIGSQRPFGYGYAVQNGLQKRRPAARIAKPNLWPKIVIIGHDCSRFARFPFQDRELTNGAKNCQ